MEKGNIVSRIYGYLVCLASIIVMLISIGMIINSIFGLSDPVHSRDYSMWNTGGDLSSFQSYKANYEQGFGAVKDPSVATATTLTDAQLLSNYNAQKDSYISGVKAHSIQNIVVYGILLLVAIGLFFTHWKWVNKLSK